MTFWVIISRAAERASATVRQLNAANTLTWRDDILYGDNTDSLGFTRALEEIAPDWRDPLTGLTVRRLRARLHAPRPVDRRRRHP